MLRIANATTIFVTHDQIEALTMADWVCVMRDGQIVQSGTPLDIYRKPADIDVAAFVGEQITIDGIVRGHPSRRDSGATSQQPHVCT